MKRHGNYLWVLFILFGGVLTYPAGPWFYRLIGSFHMPADVNFNVGSGIIGIWICNLNVDNICNLKVIFGIRKEWYFS